MNILNRILIILGLWLLVLISQYALGQDIKKTKLSISTQITKLPEVKISAKISAVKISAITSDDDLVVGLGKA